LPKFPEHLAQKIKQIPMAPGIYQMRDEEGSILYIGKSKHLKSRVRSYFGNQEKSNKIEKMVFHIHDITYIVTDTHLEAQLLECALIKKIKPLYNTQFKNHQNYSYLHVQEYNPYKPLKVLRDRESTHCFGPYRSHRTLLTIEQFFKNIYPLTKEGSAYTFAYHIFPQTVCPTTFEENKKALLEILSSTKSMKLFLKSIAEKMQEASDTFAFETACTYRDLYQCMHYLHEINIKKQKITNSTLLVGEKIGVGYKLFFISHGKILYKRKYISLHLQDLEAFVLQAKEISFNYSKVKNEKRDLDFQDIIYSELQDISSKEILYLKKSIDLLTFLNRLQSL
jgi:excinuclease ABC subunit C